MRGHEEPDPAVGLLRGPHLRGGEAEDALEGADGVLMSATQRRFGAAASKHRSSRSDGRFAGSPGSVVGGLFRPGLAPRIPSSRISRSTVHRATAIPRLFSSSQTFRAPYTLRPFSPSHTSMILSFRTTSRISRAGGSASRFFAW